MFRDALKDKVNSMKGASGDELLAALGLERRRSAVAVVSLHAALLATGMLVGAGVAFLIAPKSGRAFRQELRIKASDFADRVGEKASQAASGARSALSIEDGKQKAQLPVKHEENARPKT